MSSLITLLLVALGGISVPAVAIIFLLFYPEKIEIWSSLLWKAISNIKQFAGFAHKRYVKHDLQGRINEFTKGLSKKAPYLASKQVQVQWTEAEDTSRDSFLRDGKVIVRLRRDDPTETNFVHATYLLVSANLLHKLKKYISPSQSQAVDLKVTTDLLRLEKPSTVDLFLEEYLHPKTIKAGAKIPQLLETFDKMDESGLFYQILLQELEFLGSKVFLSAKHKNTKIIVEVQQATEFLKRIAERKVGEDVPLDFKGEYCCFGVVIMGKKANITSSGDAYITYIRKALIPKGIDTLYIVGVQENKPVIDNVCMALEETFERHRSYGGEVTLVYEEDGEESRRLRRQYLVILRKKGIGPFQRTNQN